MPSLYHLIRPKLALSAVLYWHEDCRVSRRLGYNVRRKRATAGAIGHSADMSFMQGG